MINEVAFKNALAVFNKARTGVVAALRIAIERYVRDSEKLDYRVQIGQLNYSTATTDNGPDTALVITGFRNQNEIKTFVSEYFHAPCK